MDGDRCERALMRIAAAAGRIEAAAKAPRAGGDNGELTALRGQHARLRAAVSQSLTDLDALIGGKS